MIQETITLNTLEKFEITDAAISLMQENYMPLKIIDIKDAKGATEVRQARMVVKKHRVQVEKVRKDLKANALAYGRKVDGEAKRITALLTPIEQHLAGEEKRIADEKQKIVDDAREKKEAEERAEAEAEAARIQAEKAAEEARLKKIRDEENARLKLEAEKLAEERRKINEERQEVEAEKKRIAAEERRLADIEAKRIQEIEKKKIAEQAAEEARRLTEERIARENLKAKQEKEREEAENKRLEELRPDREKILAFAKVVRSLEIPSLSTGVIDSMKSIQAAINSAAGRIEDIGNNM